MRQWLNKCDLRNQISLGCIWMTSSPIVIDWSNVAFIYSSPCYHSCGIYTQLTSESLKQNGFKCWTWRGRGDWEDVGQGCVVIVEMLRCPFSKQVDHR